MAIISEFPEKKGLNADDINDIASGEINNGFIQSQFNYSTEEQVVGRWINGKPLYQKTIEITDFSGIISTTDRHWTFVYTSLNSNYSIANILSEGTFFLWHQDNGIYTSKPIEFVNIASPVDYCSIRAFVNQTGNLQIVILNSGNTPYRIVDENKILYVTVQYTKTTD